MATFIQPIVKLLYAPIFTVHRVKTGEVLALLQPGLVFCGILLTFCFFVMNWGHARLKDWEAVKEPPQERLGAPALVCWIVSMGQLMCTLVGMHVFLALYAGAAAAMNLPRLLITLLASGNVLFAWRYLFAMIKWFHRDNGNLSKLTYAKLKLIQCYKPFLKYGIYSLIICGIFFVCECYWGSREGGLAGLLFVLNAAFASGAYTAIRGDFLERAIIDPPQVTNQGKDQKSETATLSQQENDAKTRYILFK